MYLYMYIEYDKLRKKLQKLTKKNKNLLYADDAEC